jgi:hypothetical protein
MIRFERAAELSDTWKNINRWVGFLFAVTLLILTLFFPSERKMKNLGHLILSLFFIFHFFPPYQKRTSPFVELTDEQIRWNTYHGFEKDAPPAELLQWKEITIIKLLKENELMFFVENDFYHRLHTRLFTADQQKEIINSIRDCAERFSIRWIDNTAKAA